MLTPAQKILEDFKHGQKDIPSAVLYAALIQHFEDDHQLQKTMMEKMDSIDKKLEPISQTYTSVSTLGKWGMVVLVAVSLIVGIIWGIIQVVTSLPNNHA